MSETPDQSPAVDFDRLLETVDPGFTRSLEDLNAIQNADVHIAADALEPEVHDGDYPETLAEDANFATRLMFRVRRWAVAALTLGQRIFEFLKFSGRTIAKMGSGQKIMTLLALAIFAAVIVILAANLRGVWLPGLTNPIVGRLEPYSQSVEKVTPDPKARVDLNKAFPAAVHEFLFRRFKVNLSPTSENPQPMGAFEFVVSLDVRETAIEVRDREVEFADAIQRLLEEQTFDRLATESGKSRLKDQIQALLNERLSTGRVSTVNFKTFILKP